MAEELNPATKKELDTIWTSLKILNKRCLHNDEDVLAATQAIEHLRLRLLPKYYVFHCCGCDKMYCAKADALWQLLCVNCVCHKHEQSSPTLMIFSSIETEVPGNCYVVKTIEG